MNTIIYIIAMLAISAALSIPTTVIVVTITSWRQRRQHRARVNSARRDFRHSYAVWKRAERKHQEDEAATMRDATTECHARLSRLEV